MTKQFPTFNWGKNTKVRFETFNGIPKDVPVTSCMVMAVLDKEYLVLSSPKRGWGLPGGHVEEGETPKMTAIRELREEAAVEVDKESLQVVGGWLAKKIRKTKKKSKYPDLTYQLLFIANITEVKQFTKRFEVFDRIFVPISDVLDYATSATFKPIFEYVTEEYKEAFIKREHEDKVSIIVPFINTENHIKKCLATISEQSYKNIEVLLINDGSTDDSTKICKNCAKEDDRFKVITLKRNFGLGYAKNTGLDFVTGNYVCFVGSNDYIHKEYISKILSAAVKHEADIVECQNNYLVDSELANKYRNAKYPKREFVSNGKKVLRNYLKHEKPRISSSSVCNKLYKVDLFKNNHIAFDPKLSQFEDSDIMYQLYLNTKKHVYLPEKLYYKGKYLQLNC
jgi:8-oxo-dGTP pyrophosphatase MutT (NUDIX family)